MKKPFITITFGLMLCGILIFNHACFAQDVKRAKIEEIDSYIKSRDHPVVVGFWATWCAPCLREIPWIEAAIEKNKSAEVELVLVSLDFDDAYPKKLTSFVKQKGYKATFFWLDETDADHFCPVIDTAWSGSIPASLFINPESGYRKFIARQITDRQAELEVKNLIVK